MYKKITKVIITYIYIFLVILFISEFILQALDYPAYYNSIYEFDHELGYRLAPGNHLFFAMNNKYSVFIDEQGVLDRDDSKQGDIVLLGDGVIAGLELAPENRLATQLSRRTGHSVVNLSVPGYGTVQQWLTLRRFIELNSAPKHVFILYNLTNDYYDNIPEWEGKRIPGIVQGTNGMWEIKKPQLPSIVGQKLRVFIWKIRLYSLYSQLIRDEVGAQILPIQQKWLYLKSPPEAAKLGDEATFHAAAEIYKLSNEHGFTVTWLIWRDLALEFSQGLSGITAVSNVKRLIHKSADWISIQKQQDVNLKNLDQWQKRWLNPQTRHASVAAIRHLAIEISELIHQG